MLQTYFVPVPRVGMKGNEYQEEVNRTLKDMSQKGYDIKDVKFCMTQGIHAAWVVYDVQE